jgi:aminoglycoside/choline kinase family phosphotransferase
MPSVTDVLVRDRERLAWARNALGDPDAQLLRASMDAGFRSYWRASSPTRPGSTIVMDSPPGQEDVRPWLRIREMLDSGGVRVPQVLSADVQNGFLLLEDLGIDTYLQVIDAGNADALFDDALTKLLELQALTPPTDFPVYDEALLLRELHLFDEWFVSRHLCIVLDHDERQSLELIYRRLVDAALAQPRVLVHRDFMPRNLMPASNGPAVLDFQDAVLGPVAYDVVSLFKDAFLSWPQASVDGWLDRYHARAVQAGLPVPPLAQFRRDADWIGVQRHLKVIGIFARLRHRDAKPKYLLDVPRFFDYLDGVLPNYPEFAPLQALIQGRIKPAMALHAEAQG